VASNARSSIVPSAARPMNTMPIAGNRPATNAGTSGGSTLARNPDIASALYEHGIRSKRKWKALFTTPGPS